MRKWFGSGYTSYFLLSYPRILYSLFSCSASSLLVLRRITFICTRAPYIASRSPYSFLIAHLRIYMCFGALPRTYIHTYFLCTSRFYIRKNNSCSACVNAAVIEIIPDAVRCLQFNFDPRNTAKCARDGSVRSPSQSLRRSCSCCACAARHDTTPPAVSNPAMRVLLIVSGIELWRWR